MMGDRRISGGPQFGNELTQTGRRGALLEHFCLMTPPFTAFHLVHGSHTNTDTAHCEGSHSWIFKKA